VTDHDILNIDEAAELLGVSIKTFNKVLHHENMPARKIGREWKFSRRALIDWVGSGRARDFYKDPEARDEDVEEVETRDVEVVPPGRGNGAPRGASTEKPRARRTAGWQIED
jgi:excisionase family DNA binding protein